MGRRQGIAKPKNWSEAEKLRLKQLLRRGIGASQIAAELARYTGSVKRMAREMGLIPKK